MRKVDFFIVGQPKSGTTALASFLDEHPEISISIPKELGFMAKDHMKESDRFHGHPKYFHIRTLEQYASAFAHAGSSQLVGEATTGYLYSKDAAKEIFKHNPDAKIIMMLRNPVDMIYSLYHQYRNETRENAATFKEALALEGQRKKGDGLSSRAVAPSYYLYKNAGLYTPQVKRYLELFDKKQVLAIPAEEFRKDNVAYYRKVLEFLGVLYKRFEPDFRPVNDSKAAKSTALNQVIYHPAIKNAGLAVLGQKNYTKLQKSVVEPLVFKKASRQKMDPELRKQLEDFFRKDVAKLSQMLGLNFSELWGY